MPGPPVQVTIGVFNGTSLLSGGSYGLIWTQYKVSLAHITGTGLTNSQGVTVVYPTKPSATTIQWGGQTINAASDGTSCDVELTQTLATNGPTMMGAGKAPDQGGVGDTNVNVTVSIGMASTNVAVPIGTAPP